MAPKAAARPTRITTFPLTSFCAFFFSRYLLGATRFAKNIIKNPIISPMIHDTNIKNALNAISKEPKPIPIPETAAGGIRATAIPTII